MATSVHIPAIAIPVKSSIFEVLKMRGVITPTLENPSSNELRTSISIYISPGESVSPDRIPTSGVERHQQSR